MPSSYFQQVPEQFRMDHIKAISAIKDANMDMYLNLKSHTQDGRTIYTFIRPGTDPGTLLSMVEELPFHPEQNLTRLHVFSSLDGSMSLNMFVYGESPTKPRLYLEDENIQKILSFADQVQQGQVHDIAPHPLFEKESLVKYLALCKDNYLKIVSQHPERFLRQRLLFDSVSGTEGVEVSVEPAIHERIHNQERDDYYWVDVAMANSLPQVALEHTCRLLYVQGFDVGRARLDVIPDGDNGSVTLLRLLVHPLEQDLQDDATVAQKFELLQSELKRAKWLDDTTQKLVFERYPELGVARGEIITAFAGVMHPILAKQNAIVYSKHNILDMVTHPRMIGHASKIADLFLDRFHPENPVAADSPEFQARLNEIRAAIETDVEESTVSDVLYKMMDIVTHTLKTNIYMQDRYALSLRLDPI
ncbi:MAG: hypothetical protein SGILL_003586, partial [Bacillariaceae sp.]